MGVTPEEIALVEDIGKEIVWQQQRNMVLSVWCLIATVLLQRRTGITVNELTETVLWLKRHANNVGAYIDWPSELSNKITTLPVPVRIPVPVLHFPFILAHRGNCVYPRSFIAAYWLCDSKTAILCGERFFEILCLELSIKYSPT